MPTTQNVNAPKETVALRLGQRAITALDLLAADDDSTRSATACRLLERVLLEEVPGLAARAAAAELHAEAGVPMSEARLAVAGGEEAPADVNVNDGPTPDRSEMVAAAERRAVAAGRPGAPAARRAGAEWDRAYGAKA